MSEAPARAKSSRISALDGLRGVAAVLVVLDHLMLSLGPPALPFYGDTDAGSWNWTIYSPVHLLWAGREAVLVFFVLSGFVLTQPVLNSRQFSWRAYYPSRLIRLYLPVIAAVGFASMLRAGVDRSSAAARGPWMADHLEPLTISSVVKNALLLAGTDWLNSPLWSLRWEVAFSLLLPVYIWIALHVKRAWWLIVVAAAAIEIVGLRIHQDSVTYLPVFMLGVLAAVHQEKIARFGRWLTGRRLRGPVLLTLALLAFVAKWLVGAVAPNAPDTATAPIVLAGSTLLVLLAWQWGPLRRLLEKGSPRTVGRLSFSLYLTHEPIVITIAVLLPLTMQWFAVLLTLALVLPVAWLFFRLVEAPSHRLSQAVRGRVATGSAKARAASLL